MKRHAASAYIIGIAFVAMIVAQCVPSAPAKSKQPPQLAVRPALHAYLNNLPILVDLDSDRRLDLAELHLAGAHCCVRVRLGNSSERHLAFLELPHAQGTLLTRDINQDNKPDLVWVSPFGPEPAQVWLGDGLGHFSGAGYQTAGDSLRKLLFGDPSTAVAGTTEDDQDILTPDPVSTELARPASLERETCRAGLIAAGTDRRDVGLYLSYLRKRGPPQLTFSV
jgi:hypothetical protein